MSKRIKSNKASITSFLNKVEGEVSAGVKGVSDSVSKTVAERVYEKSQEYVPKKSGDLAGSGRIEKKANGHYEVIYGNNEIFYAFFVEHNLPSPPENKNYTTPGTGPLYLTRAVDEVGSDREVVQSLRDELGRFRKRLPKGK